MSIREATPADVPAMLEIYAYFVEHTAVSFEYETPTRGYIYAGAPFERAAYRWCAEISCYLAPEARGRGVGRQLYARTEEILRAQGYRTVYAVVTSANAPSMAFHKALGYREFAKFAACGFKNGAWYDVSWLEKRLQPDGAPERFPISWREL